MSGYRYKPEAGQSKSKKVVRRLRGQLWNFPNRVENFSKKFRHGTHFFKNETLFDFYPSGPKSEFFFRVKSVKFKISNLWRTLVFWDFRIFIFLDLRFYENFVRWSEILKKKLKKWGPISENFRNFRFDFETFVSSREVVVQKKSNYTGMDIFSRGIDWEWLEEERSTGTAPKSAQRVGIDDRMRPSGDIQCP